MLCMPPSRSPSFTQYWFLESLSGLSIQVFEKQFTCRKSLRIDRNSRKSLKDRKWPEDESIFVCVNLGGEGKEGYFTSLISWNFSINFKRTG